MGSEWQEVTIESIASRIAMGPFGSDIKTDNFVPSGVPVIRGGNLTQGRFNAEGFVFLTEQKADQLLSANAFPGDLVFTHRGTLGQVGLIPPSPYQRYVVSQSQMKLSCDPLKADPGFMYYFFKSPLGQQALLMHTSQTGVPAISRPVTSLKSIRLMLPPLPEQRAIAAVLGSLDDKIELNQRMNGTLEGLARALFRAWFVDFEPVRAKMAGRPTGLVGEIEALFPDGMKETEDGVERPRGWRVDSFASTVEIIGGGTPKTNVAEYWDGDIPWFAVVDAPSECDVFVIDTAKKITELGIQNSSAQILPVGTVIISARGTVGKIAMVGVPMAMNQSCYGLNGQIGRTGAFAYFSTLNLTTTLKQNAHGSVFDTITRETLARVNVIVPPTNVVAEFERVVAPLLDRIKSNLFETRTLAALRDGLLPGLMRGEVRVSNLENVFGVV